MDAHHPTIREALESAADRTDELISALKEAKARIEDLLHADDGQAHKEARRALPRIEAAIAKATGGAA